MKKTISYDAYQKSPYQSIKHSTYFDVYDDLFLKYRGKDVTFVEIGVLGGGSLFMWREFFGPEARIIGVDLNPNAKKWEAEGFEIYIGSQSDKEFWEKFINEIGKVDIVLDDGGHSFEQQIITTEMLIENIKDGGILVVEDTHTSYLKGFGPAKYSFLAYSKLLVDKINFRYRKLNKKGAERRIWSIIFYESFVAFKVNRTASNLPSEPTYNGGQDDMAEDYRSSIISIFKYVPGAKLVRRRIVTPLIDRGQRIKKYFR